MSVTDIDIAQPRASHVHAFAHPSQRDRDRVVVSMRRIVSAHTKRTMVLEAMVHAPGGGADVIDPATLNETFGDLRGLDLFVINRAANEIRRWRGAGWDEARLLVQCARSSLLAPHFTDDVMEIVGAHDLSADSIWIGVDHTLFGDADVLTVLRSLSNRGIGIVPSGVGADLSVAPLWTVLHVAAIRMDDRLVPSAGLDDWWAALVTAIVDTGRELGCPLLGDGIDTELDEMTATELGVELLAGPRYGRSFDPDELLHPLLDESRPNLEFRIDHSPVPPDEEDRLRALRACEVLDTEPEAVFDAITQAAAQLCDAPISVISLVDRDRQWFKSRVGLDVSETPRDMAFCAVAVMGHDPLVVEDALADQRFRRNPLVVTDPTIRFYAGIPLVTSGGQAIGTLCVIDRRPRSLTDDQLAGLRDLAQQVVFHLEW